MNTTTSSPTHDHSGKSSCPGCKASSKPPKVRVGAKCMVSFRPTTKWEGEFGFDWIREGKNGEVYSHCKGDNAYEEVVGAYTKKDKSGNVIYGSADGATITVDPHAFHRLTGRYDRLHFSWKKSKKKHKKRYLYYAAWLSLYPENEIETHSRCQATLHVTVEIKKPKPAVLRFDYNEEYFELQPKEFPDKSVGKHEFDLTVKCKQGFAKDQEIKVMTHKKDDKVYGSDIAGKLIVVKNKKELRCRVRLLYVNVSTNIGNGVKYGPTGVDHRMMRMIFHQSLAAMDIRDAQLDLTNDSLFNSTFTILPVAGGTNAIGVYGANGTTSLYDYCKTALNQTLKKKLDKDQGAGVITADQRKEQQDYYDNSYKMFSFDELGGYFDKNNKYVGLDGKADAIVSDSVAVFQDHEVSVAPHELLHALGFYHSFDNDQAHGAFAFECGKTDNIMDYSDLDKYGPIPLIATWKWQWDQLRSLIGNGKIVLE
jgi:hypothetical protein